MKENFKIHKHGKQIILRDWKEDDVAMFSKWNTIGHEWQELDGPYYERSEEAATQSVEKLKNIITGKIFSVPRSRLVIACKESDRLIGTVGSYWESKETNWLSAGIVIYDPSSWGRGIGFESLGLWTEFLFEEYPEIIRLDLRTWSGNKGLINLAAKIGFVQEACFRKARIVKGEYFDSLGFGILKSEFFDKYKSGFLK